MLGRQTLISLIRSTHSVPRCVELRQELAVDEELNVIDHEEHDGLWYEVPARLGHDLHVGVHQVPDRLHLALKLRVHGAQANRVLALKTREKENVPLAEKRLGPCTILASCESKVKCFAHLTTTCKTHTLLCRH